VLTLFYVLATGVGAGGEAASSPFSVQIELGEAALAQGRAPEAATHWKTALELAKTPDQHGTALWRLVDVSHQLGHLESAISYQQALVSLNEAGQVTIRDPLARLALARLYDEAGEWDAAATEWQTAIANLSGTDKAQAEAGYAKHAALRGDHGIAVFRFEQAFERFRSLDRLDALWPVLPAIADSYAALGDTSSELRVLELELAIAECWGYRSNLRNTLKSLLALDVDPTRSEKWASRLREVTASPNRFSGHRCGDVAHQRASAWSGSEPVRPSP